MDFLCSSILLPIYFEDNEGTKILKTTEHRFLKKNCGHCIFCSSTFAKICSSNLDQETTFPTLFSPPPPLLTSPPNPSSWILNQQTASALHGRRMQLHRCLVSSPPPPPSPPTLYQHLQARLAGEVRTYQQTRRRGLSERRCPGAKIKGQSKHRRRESWEGGAAKERVPCKESET